MKSGNVTVTELANLAANTGLVPNTYESKMVFMSRMAKDPTTTRKELFTHVKARRVAATSAPITQAQAAAALAPQYPAGWLRAKANHPARRITEGS
jgi:hypothetical protein